MCSWAPHLASPRDTCEDATARWGGCFGCFAFWQRWPSQPSQRRRRVRLDAADAQVLPDLDQACEEVQRTQRSALLRRRLQVTSKLLPVASKIAWQQLTGSDKAVENTRRLRQVLEALGPAFVKLGQAAACREDILSEVVAAELRKLCDQVAPFDHGEAQRLVRCQLGDVAFQAALGAPCVAAASLGQVYRIDLDGQRYAMKVQRPGLNRALAMDVVILKGIARFVRVLVRRFMAASLDPVQIVEDWAKTLWDELDYKKEAQSMEEMRHALCGSVSGLTIPRVNWQFTSLRVLATEWVDGLKITEQPKAVNHAHVAVGVEAFAAMILDVGVVHADPHPGNFIVTGDSSICLLDFGMVCRVPPAHRHAWAKCVVDLVRKDHGSVLDDLIEIGFFPHDCPRDEILPVMSKIWAKLVECGSDIHKRKSAVQLLYAEILILVRRFKFHLPDYYVALVRALLTLEGIALAADCNFDIFEAAFPVALRFLSTSAPGSEKSILTSTALKVLQNRSVAKLLVRFGGNTQVNFKGAIFAILFLWIALLSLCSVSSYASR